MKNWFFERPTEDNIKEIGVDFCLHDALIAVDTNDQYFYGNVSKHY